MRVQALAMAGLIAMSALAAGCETSNQDYSHSSRVVQVTTGPQGSYRGSSSSQYNAGAQVQPAQPVYQAQALESDYQVPPEPQVQVVSAPTQAPAPAPAEPVAYQPAAAQVPPPPPASSGTAGVVQPYVPDSADTYRVVKGDTLYSIAFRYGLDYRSLAKDNGIEPPYNIAVGQVIKLNLKTSQAPTYTVKKGDTLYSIAKANGQSVDFLAGVNNLSRPYTLKVGQVLYLARVDSTSTANRAQSAVVPVAGQSTQSAQPKPAATAAAPAPAKPVVVSGKTRTVSGIKWMWPTQGKVIENFSLAEQGNKGIDISGTQGQQILAAADGQVVYAGNALRGYGNLIIINHDNEFLSAYAHNDALLVTEGQKVVRGQQIARMGSTDAKSVRLHFEIRYRGQSVNPVNYLPQ